MLFACTLLGCSAFGTPYPMVSLSSTIGYKLGYLQNPKTIAVATTSRSKRYYAPNNTKYLYVTVSLFYPGSFQWRLFINVIYIFNWEN